MRPFSQRSPGELFLPANLAEGWYGPSGSCGCCGEVECLIVEQLWSGYGTTADMESPGGALPTFEEVAGDWETVSGSSGGLTVDSANALLISNDDPGTPYYRVWCNIRSGSSVAEDFRIISNYEDDDNYIYGEASTSVTSGGTGTLRIVQVSGGTPTTIATRSITGDWNLDDAIGTQFQLCIRPDLRVHLYLLLNNITGAVWHAITGELSGAPSGTRWGFGTGAAYNDPYWTDEDVSGSGDEGFHVILQTADNSCPSCTPCIPCEPSSVVGDAPSAMQVVISGMGSGPLGCSPTNCGSLDGTYIVPWVPVPGTISPGLDDGCMWRLPVSVAIGGTCGTALSLCVVRGRHVFPGSASALVGLGVYFSTSAKGGVTSIFGGSLTVDIVAWSNGTIGGSNDQSAECFDDSISVTLHTAGSSRPCGVGTCTVSALP